MKTMKSTTAALTIVKVIFSVTNRGMEKIIAGNWKMNTTRAEARALSARVAAHVSPSRVLLCPPAVWLSDVVQAVDKSNVFVGGQDCHAEAAGAHTGDVSAAMLAEVGCRYVILGHSERRAEHGETDALVAAKAARAHATGLTPIICVGESLTQREQGLAMEVVARQLAQCLPKAGGGDFILAYEPIWAIGTGRIPSHDDIAAIHARIFSLAGVGALYGGSVKPANAREIMQIPHVSGVLVGGASTVAEDFLSIIDAAN